MIGLNYRAAVIAAAFAAGAALALDNTINNDFWDTRNYVNPTPNEAASDGEVADTIIANEQPSNTLAFFRSYPALGTVLMLR